MSNHLRIIRRGLLATILATAIMQSFRALAAVETVDAYLPPTQTDYSDPLAVDQFNPDLGTLESVTITAIGTGQSSGNSFNNTGDYLTDWSTEAGLDLCVACNCVMVPEPSTWPAGIFAAGGLLIYVSRLNRKQSRDLLE